jgi:uncharacterized SAM-binding protein YcdF (DUF218 family)
MMAWIKRLFALVILLLLIVSAPLWRILAIDPLSSKTNAQAAIVLGAATSQNKMSNAFKARVDYAIELYQQKRVDQLIFTGGYRDKNPDKDLSEAAVAKAYALSKGVPASAISLDEVSTTTLENIREAKKRMADLNLKNALVVSDEWHLARAVQMAKDEGLQVVGAPTPYSVYQSTSKKIEFVWREVKTTWAYWVAGI